MKDWLLNAFLKEKKLWLMTGLLLILLAGYFLLQLKSSLTKSPYSREGKLEAPAPRLLVSRVEPKPDQTGVSTSPTIKIYFDRPIKNIPVEIVAEPEFTFDSSPSVDTLYMTLTPTENLTSDTAYTMEVKLGEAIIYSWSFTTGEVIGPAGVLAQIKKELPVKGDHFAISYWPSTDKFFITIDAKPVDNYKNAAFDWFRARGLNDPEKQINIVIIPVGEAAH